MVFKFTVQPSFNFLTSFAEKLKVPVVNNRLQLPPSLGQGYVKKIDIETDFKFVMHHYNLKQELHLKRMEPQEKNDLISIVFNSIEVPTNLSPAKRDAIQFIKNHGSAIQIASSSLGTESKFPAGSEVYFGVVGIHISRLMPLLHLQKINSLVETMLSPDTPFFFHENMTPDVNRILRQLSAIDDQDQLSHLSYRIKTQDLLYLLFHKLLSRDDDRQSHINKADLEKLYEIRTTIIKDLSQPPRLNELAKRTSLSETKMKQLFKQVFGDSIYNYYQHRRMEEAAFLLRESGYSVSEVGYGLGFSNLSHFSRLFEKYHGLTPKKFSVTG